MIKEITPVLMDELLEKAAQSERKRTHLLFHEDVSEAIHRFCVAAMPETVFKPHRHPGKWELLVLLRGSVMLHLFQKDGTEFKQIHLVADGNGDKAVELPEEYFHQMVVEEPCVFFEIKAGPYAPPEELN